MTLPGHSMLQLDVHIIEFYLSQVQINPLLGNEHTDVSVSCRNHP